MRPLRSNPSTISGDPERLAALFPGHPQASTWRRSTPLGHFLNYDPMF